MWDRGGRNEIRQRFEEWIKVNKCANNKDNLNKYLDLNDSNTINSYENICSFSIFMSLHYDNKVWARFLA